MSELKWIKMTIDMFDNRKIKYLRRLPDGNSIVLIWVMLLTMAGRCNAGGMIFLTETIPYTPKLLADELGFEENTVKLALEALEHLEMIIINDGYFAISGWDEYQNIDGMERIREQTRQRNIKYRERKKLAANARDVTVTHRDATEEDKEEDREEESKENDISNDMSQKKISKKEFSHDSKAYKCARWLSKQVLARYPCLKPHDEKTLQTWAADIDKCNRIDGYEWEDISDVIRFSQEDKFWQQNIRSGAAVRKQFETLLVKMLGKED